MTAAAKKEFQEVRDEIEVILQNHRDFLVDEPRLRRPLEEARAAAKTKYEDRDG